MSPRKSKEADRVAHQRYRARHLERIREHQRALTKHPVIGERRRAYARAYYHSKVKRKYRFGITPEQFAARLAEQGGRCAICGTDKPVGRGDWHLDHHHDFDKRDPAGHRGILCAHCNVMLGMAKDDPAILATAILYLNGWNN
jgi:hypothetical protein